MRRWRIEPVSWPILTALALALAVSARGGEPTLVGTWTLISAVQVRADGSTRPVAFVAGSDHATGQLDYSPDGTVAVQIVGHPRTDFGGLPGAAPPPAVAAGVLQTYYAYFGRYVVDPARHVVTHHVVESLWPGENGQDYARHYAIAGDRLTFDTMPRTVDGETVFNRLVWSRASPLGPAD